MIEHMAPVPTKQTASFYGEKILNAKNKADPQKVGGQFEGIFYRMLLDQIQESQEDDPIFGTSEISQSTGMFYDEIAMIMGDQKQLGIGDIIAKDVLKNASPEAQKQIGLLKQARIKGE
jgi:Rod binding domain-containing protein